MDYVVFGMKRLSEDKDQCDLKGIMKFSTALGFGLMCAFLCSLKDVAHEAWLEFSAGTVVAFFVGALAGWWFWVGVFHFSEKKAQELERKKRGD